MSTIDIILTVFACVWAVLMVIAGYCCYKANKARQEACQLLSKTKQRVESIDYELGKSINTAELLQLLKDDELIWTDFYPLTKQEFAKEYPDKLELEVKGIRFWYEPSKFQVAVQFIWIDNEDKK